MRKYTYRKLKAQARQEAIDLQIRMSNESLSWSAIAYITNHLATLGKRYGLTKEFRENGLI